jgi:hypothetical protein
MAVVVGRLLEKISSVDALLLMSKTTVEDEERAPSMYVFIVFEETPEKVKAM